MFCSAVLSYISVRGQGNAKRLVVKAEAGSGKTTLFFPMWNANTQVKKNSDRSYLHRSLDLLFPKSTHPHQKRHHIIIGNLDQILLRGNCTPNQKLACFVLYLKIINMQLFEKIILSKELKNDIEILVDQALYKLWTKTVKWIYFF